MKKVVLRIMVLYHFETSKEAARVKAKKKAIEEAARVNLHDPMYNMLVTMC